MQRFHLTIELCVRSAGKSLSKHEMLHVCVCVCACARNCKWFGLDASLPLELFVVYVGKTFQLVSDLCSKLGDMIADLFALLCWAPRALLPGATQKTTAVQSQDL